MREMPHGQWVPFDGYDSVHDCRRSANQRSSNNAQASKGSYWSSDLGFADDFVVKKTIPQSGSNRSSPKNAIPMQTAQPAANRSSSPNKHASNRELSNGHPKTDGLSAVQWAAVAVVVVVVLLIIF